MIVEVHNIDKIMQKISHMKNMQDNPVGIVSAETEYAVYVEYGHRVVTSVGKKRNTTKKRNRRKKEVVKQNNRKAKDGFVVGSYFMKRSLDSQKKFINKIFSTAVKKSKKEQISLKPYMQLAVKAVQAQARFLVPVDTGNLRRNIKTKVLK